jgi:hypothetical protein
MSMARWQKDFSNGNTVRPWPRQRTNELSVPGTLPQQDGLIFGFARISIVM